jgi:hypothetical protein
MLISVIMRHTTELMENHSFKDRKSGMTAKPIERFDCTSGGYAYCQGCFTMEKEEYGDYVRYEDHVAELKLLQDQIIGWINLVEAQTAVLKLCKESEFLKDI